MDWTVDMFDGNFARYLAKCREGSVKFDVVFVISKGVEGLKKKVVED